MASIISSGIGSGLDIAGIVQQLVAAEGQPVESRISQQEARATAKLSAFGSIKSSLADFRDKLEVMKDLDKFLSRRAESSNSEFFSVTAGSDALPASYSLDIVQLAQAQKLTSSAFADTETAVGTGTLTLTIGTTSADIEITSENNTLAGIQAAINAAPDNPGVAATIVNADSGSYLILTAESTGAANGITVTQAGGDGGLSALEYDPGMGLTALTESIAAQDALIRIDGFEVGSDTNSFSGAIPGVAIDIFQQTSGSSETIRVENDVEAVRDLLDDFVESYNQLIDTFDSITNYDAETEVAAALVGDATIRSIRDQIRREMSNAVDNPNLPFSVLRDIGIEVQLDGSMKVNDDEVSDVLASEFTKVGQLFADTSSGFATRLFDLTDSFLDSDGIIEARTKGLTETIDGLADDRTALTERLASLETRLLRQFNALDSLLAELSSTSNFLAQQLNNLPGYTNPGQSG